MIKQNIRPTLLPYKFELLADDNGTHITDSRVVVDFEPLLIANGLLYATNIVIIHVKARPIKDKNLWKYGVLYINEDGVSSYYLVDNYQSSGVDSRGIKHRESDVVNPPNMCCLFENANIVLDDSGNELIGMISSI